MREKSPEKDSMKETINPSTLLVLLKSSICIVGNDEPRESKKANNRTEKKPSVSKVQKCPLNIYGLLEIWTVGNDIPRHFCSVAVMYSMGIP